MSIRATNAGGQTTVIERTFEVEAIPPRLEIEGLSGDTVVSDTLSGTITAQGQSPIVSLSVEPDVGARGQRQSLGLHHRRRLNFPPGPNTVAIRVSMKPGRDGRDQLNF